MSDVGKVAEAITELTKAVSKYFGSSDHRRMTKCVRNADRIVKRIKEMEIDDKELNRLMKKHDKYNN